jgi:hypothetical protein
MIAPLWEGRLSARMKFRSLINTDAAVVDVGSPSQPENAGDAIITSGEYSAYSRSRLKR